MQDGVCLHDVYTCKAVHRISPNTGRRERTAGKSEAAAASRYSRHVLPLVASACGILIRAVCASVGTDPYEAVATCKYPGPLTLRMSDVVALRTRDHRSAEEEVMLGFPPSPTAGDGRMPVRNCEWLGAGDAAVQWSSARVGRGWPYAIDDKAASSADDGYAPRVGDDADLKLTSVGSKPVAEEAAAARRRARNSASGGCRDGTRSVKVHPAPLQDRATDGGGGRGSV